VLNYLLIFGHYGFPRFGIAGAALATGLSSFSACVLAVTLLLRPENRRKFNTWPTLKWQPEILKRMLQYGLPNGIHFFLDISAFNMFTILFGWLGKAEQEAAAIAFSMNAIAFIPMIGIGMTVSILVGQAIGAQNLVPARRAVRSALFVVLLYMGTLGLLFIFKPMMFVHLFMRGDGGEQIRAMELAAGFLKFIAAYLLFDGLFIVYNSAIKGAGDTRFAMFAGVTLAWVLMVLPCLVAYHLGAGPAALWRIFIFYVMISGLIFFGRYKAGNWTSMNVIGT
jgi:MATE family multidrug resistance protein